MVATQRVETPGHAVAAGWPRSEYGRASVEAAGFTPEDMSRTAKIDFSQDMHDGAKAWKTVWSAGQGVANIHDVLPTAELVARMISEYEDTRRRLCGAA